MPSALLDLSVALLWLLTLQIDQLLWFVNKGFKGFDVNICL